MKLRWQALRYFALAAAILISLHISATKCYAYDIDGDGDVDLTDFAVTAAICSWIGGCDLRFWAGFQNSFTG